MKKIILGVLCIALTTSFLNFSPVTAKADDFEVLRNDSNIVLEDIVSTNYYEAEDENTKNILNVEKNKDVLIHNNGEKLETNLLVEKNGFDLVAVHKVITDDYDYAQYYFSDENIDGDIENIKKEIKDKNLVAAKSIYNEKLLKNSYVRNFSWNFNYSGSTVYKLTNSVSLERKNNKVNIDGVTGSAWDISSVAAIESQVSNGRINDQYTRLSIQAFGSQKLIDYGPSSTTSQNVGVSLSRLGIPSVSWSFNIGNWTTKDLSSFSNKYGRWRFVGPVIGYSKRVTTRPGIRASNTRGNFGLEVSHTTATNHGNFQTGIAQIFVPDR
ncbi:hypothetical protein [uncultured Clostridium sp.]|jgi:hypothetical protein|uniref:hypothetical protein n=1 Tax=uncultured Clostridium sp. TaxID=59620 RepID=UPI002638CE1C|nr:hypothetical protein [uncultured Clostridium sp.]